MTRAEFAEAVRSLLTDDQRRQIRDLHDQLQEAYEFGCCAHNEGDDCCVDVLVGERAPGFRVGWHVEDCQCLARDGAVLNVDLRCQIP